MMTTDPILAVMLALDTGVRTQATADLEEAGCRVQTSGNRGAGSGHNGQYWPVWAHIAGAEREAPGQASTLLTLYAPTEEESNKWVDVMHEMIVTMMAGVIPGWSDMRKKKRDQISWLAFAAIVERRSDLERIQAPWQPERYRYYLAEHHGVSLPQHNWQRDWQPFLAAAQACIEKAEDAALSPVSAIIRSVNQKERQEVLKAA